MASSRYSQSVKTTANEWRQLSHSQHLNHPATSKALWVHTIVSTPKSACSPHTPGGVLVLVQISPPQALIQDVRLSRDYTHSLARHSNNGRVIPHKVSSHQWRISVSMKSPPLSWTHLRHELLREDLQQTQRTLKATRQPHLDQQ